MHNGSNFWQLIPAKPNQYILNAYVFANMNRIKTH